MRWIRNIFVLLIFAALLAAPQDVRAQMNWAQVTTSISPSFVPIAIVAEDGIVVAGGNGLAISTNEGSTWQMLALPVTSPNIAEIAIFDRNIFAFQSGTSRIYITEDRGNTWRSFLGGSAVIPTFPMVFLGDPSKILCMSTNNDFVYTSNGGNTFSTSATTLNPYQLKLAADGTLRLFSRTDSSVCTAWSIDTGRNWTSSTVLPYRDCFSMIADPLDENIHCLINEDFYFREHVSMIFRTSDNGTTWDTTLTHDLNYLAGSSDVGCTDYFVSTVNDGILRSANQGVSWQRIGGPNADPDYRNLAAADDSLLFVIADDNSIWATRPVSHTWKIKVRNLLNFSNASLISCDTFRTGMVIVYGGCSGAGIARATIIGSDSGYYDFLDSADASFPDTLLVRFTSPGAGTTSARLKIVLDDSTNYDYDLSVTTIAPEANVTPRELMLDTTIYCEPITDTIRLEAPCPMAITNITISGQDSGAFTVLGGASRSLPEDSIVIIRFTPQRLGYHSGLVRITTQYGRIHIIPIRPYVTTAPLAVVFDTIFARDTLWHCQNGLDTIKLRSLCSLTNVALSLTDSSNYQLLTKQSLSLPQDSIIIVSYSSNGKTNIGSYLILRSPYLDSIDIPLRRSFKRAPVTLVFQPRVAQDTFSFCREVIDTLIFGSQCPHTTANMRLEGPDAAKFKIISPNLKLPEDSTIIISCSTNQPGQLNADLVFETEDGFTNRYRLMPVFITSPFKFGPASLFTGDSVGACIGGYDTLRIASDCPLKVKAISIIGADASAFVLVNSAPLQLPDDSVIIVRCLPGTKGRRIAALRIELEDGRVWNVTLSALVVDAPIKIAPAALFVKDSISSCSFGFDTLRLIAPCPIGIKSMTLQGADASLFSIETPPPVTLPEDSIVIIRFTPAKAGNIAAYLRIEAVDGRVWTVPFRPVGVEAKLRFTSSALFTNDTILSCGSLSDTLHLSADCPLELISLSITGSDASAFALTGSSSITLPQDSSITVVCTPSRSGQLDATLHIVSADGRIWDIPMSVFAVIAPLTLSKTTLFEEDSIYVCETVSDTLKLSSLCPLDIAELSLSGADAASYSLNNTQMQLPANSSVIITCQPKSIGRNAATLQLRSADGRTWDVPMSVFARSAPLEFSPQALFERDSFTVCDRRSDTLYLRTLCPLAITDVSITGADQASFEILRYASSLPDDSVIIIGCAPQRSGALAALLHITLSDGRALDIPLMPFANDFATLTFDPIASATTDTLGGDIIMPITATRTGGGGLVEFTLRYDEEELVLHGVFDSSNADKTVVRDNSKARVAFDAENTTMLEARFSYFPVKAACTNIRIDSITASGGNTDCLLNLTGSLTADICAPDFCGRPAIARFLRYGDMPEFSIVPNPSTGNVVLFSDKNIENAKVEIIDAFGVIRKTFNNLSFAKLGIVITTDGLASGVYEVRVTNETTRGSARWVLSR